MPMMTLPHPPSRNMQQPQAYQLTPFFSHFQSSVLLKLDAIVKNQEIQITLLQGAGSGDREEQMTMLEDMLPGPVNSVQQLQQLNTKLEERLELMKKMGCVISHCTASHPIVAL